MYLRSLVVFALCTMFVLGFAFVLNYEAGQVGKGTTLVTTRGSCTSTGVSCPSFSVSQAVLLTNNYNDTLGPGSHIDLSFTLGVLAGSTLSSVSLYLGNVSVGSVQGPYAPGLHQVTDYVLPTTVSATAGATYTLTVEGLFADGSTAWTSTQATAR